MKFYDFSLAPNPRRVRIFLAEKGIEVPSVQINTREAEQFSDAYKAVNPNSMVPSLELDDGTCIGESVAICRYFEDRALPGMQSGVPQIPALVERGKRSLARFFTKLDTQLADNQFLAGDAFSIADITSFVVIDFVKRVDIEIPADWPNVARWYAEVAARPSANA